TILPDVEDLDPVKAMPWAIFELSCMAPAGMKLAEQRLMAGDLSLSFADKQRSLSVRQIALAELALTRMALEKWLANQQQVEQKHYRSNGQTKPMKILADNHELTGVLGHLRRRRRFFWNRRLAGELITYALRDSGRDRLVLLQGND